MSKWQKKENETRFWLFQDDVKLLMKYNAQNEQKILVRIRKVSMPRANLLSDPFEVFIANQCVKTALAILDPIKPPPKTYRVNLNIGKEKYTRWIDKE